MADRVNRYTGTTKRTVGEAVEKNLNPGPFIAVVRSHLDPTYMGGLEVELLTRTKGGNLPKGPIPVKYLSPFAGQTSFDGLRPNDGDQYSQKSYGFWFVPPDVGSRVLVIFAEGGQGFWIGCIPDEQTNFMTPAGDAATTYNEDDTAKKVPVGEYNKSLQELGKKDPTRFLKPVNSRFTEILNNQGLLEDETRGLTSSSARRELPSAVYGISTPGPSDRTAGSHRFNYGFSDQQVYHNRLGGSSLVFDDGDASKLRTGPAKDVPYEYVNKEQNQAGGDPAIAHNEMLRLKTRTGHQIILHNAEELIYISNAQGTAWVELTANGKIDVYAEDSISVHSKQDVNIKADRDINMEAGRDFNVKASKTYQKNEESPLEGGDIRFEAKSNYSLKVDENSKITTGKQFDVNTGTANYFTAGTNTEINSGGDHIEQTGGVVHMNGPAANIAQTAEPLILHTLPADNNTVINVIMKRVPQHEPWPHHENLNPPRYTGEQTNRLSESPVEDSVLVNTGDTFRKGSV